jgi:hypothetical protein
LSRICRFCTCATFGGTERDRQNRLSPKSRTAVVGAMRGAQLWCSSAQESPSMRLCGRSGFCPASCAPLLRAGGRSLRVRERAREGLLMSCAENGG